MQQRGGRKVSFGTSGGYRPNYEQPKKQIHVGRYIKPILALLVVLSLFYIAIFSPLFRVRTIAVRGNQQLTATEVQQQVVALLNKSFLGDNAIFVNPEGLAKELRAANYQLEEVRVERSLLGGLRVTIKEQQATLQWKSGSSVFVLSGNGVAYAEQQKLNTSLPTVEDSTNLPVKTGQKIVPSSFVAFVTDLNTKLASAGVVVASISVPETTTELAIKTKQGIVIKFDTTRNVEGQIMDYRSVMAKKISPKEYIDLRIAGKVFYK